MNEKQVRALAEGFLAAWNAQDVKRVVACYTEDVIYRDPNTRGEVKGSAALGKYLAKLFEPWQMHWSLREAYPLAGRDGAAVLWHASFKRKGGEETVESDGMDLVLVRGDRIERNDVYFDRVALAPLMGG